MGQDWGFEEVEETYDVVLVRPNFIRPRPQEKVCTC